MALFTLQTKGPVYMRLSWNEIRARAATFAQEWAGAGYEKGQTQLFYRDFFDVFGMPVRRVAAFEEPVKLLGDRRGFIDPTGRSARRAEKRRAGHDLTKVSRPKSLDFPGLKDADLPALQSCSATSRRRLSVVFRRPRRRRKRRFFSR